MKNLPIIAEKIHLALEVRTHGARPGAFQCAPGYPPRRPAIRAIHREEHDAAYEQLAQARELVSLLQNELKRVPRAVLCWLHPGRDQGIRRSQYHLRAD